MKPQLEEFSRTQQML